MCTREAAATAAGAKQEAGSETVQTVVMQLCNSPGPRQRQTAARCTTPSRRQSLRSPGRSGSARCIRHPVESTAKSCLCMPQQSISTVSRATAEKECDLVMMGAVRAAHICGTRERTVLLGLRAAAKHLIGGQVDAEVGDVAVGGTRSEGKGSHVDEGAAWSAKAHRPARVDHAAPGIACNQDELNSEVGLSNRGSETTGEEPKCLEATVP